MSTIDCGECNQFLAIALSYYQDILDRYGFRFVACLADRGGRECTTMYSNDRANLLLDQSDGSQVSAIGDAVLPFPSSGWSGVDGEGGWYSMIGVIEYLQRKKLLTPKLMKQFVSGTRAYLQWESQIVAKRLDQVMSLFEPDHGQAWREDFAVYARTRRYA